MNVYMFVFVRCLLFNVRCCLGFCPALQARQLCHYTILKTIVNTFFIFSKKAVFLVNHRFFRLFRKAFQKISKNFFNFFDNLFKTPYIRHFYILWLLVQTPQHLDFRSISAPAKLSGFYFTKKCCNMIPLYSK